MHPIYMGNRMNCAALLMTASVQYCCGSVLPGHLLFEYDGKLLNSANGGEKYSIYVQGGQ